MNTPTTENDKLIQAINEILKEDGHHTTTHKTGITITTKTDTNNQERPLQTWTIHINNGQLHIDPENLHIINPDWTGPITTYDLADPQLFTKITKFLKDNLPPETTITTPYNPTQPHLQKAE